MAITRSSGAGFAASPHGSFAGKAVDLGVIVDAFLTTRTASPFAIKKAGIPANTDPWLRTNMEILMGRRGNAVAIPAKPTITFSATPTKEECEALYNYANEMHTALNKIITRFDS